MDSEQTTLVGLGRLFGIAGLGEDLIDIGDELSAGMLSALEDVAELPGPFIGVAIAFL